MMPQDDRRTRLRRRLTVTALGCLVAAGCSAQKPSAPRPRDLLLITLDTVRADRFSYAGGPAGIVPHVDALAAEGVGFSNAITPVPLTLPAHASLMTGRQPPSHTVRDNGTFRLPPKETTLAELLHDAGFATGAFIGSQVLDSRYGLNQGFDTYDDEIHDSSEPHVLDYPERNAEEVAAAAARWLAGRDDSSVFAWVHLYDPHTPYRPPEPERSRFPSAYDAEIAYADRVVGWLLDRWEEMRGLERTLVVVTSDHGEGLGEHGELTHGILVHDATLRVPLVIRSPGLRREAPVTAPVHLVDVMPTVLGLFGLDVPQAVQGRDLGPVLRGGLVSWSPASGYAGSLYAQLHHGFAPVLALREEGWKIVRGVKDEVYDLAQDPRELHDVAVAQPERQRDLAQGLDALLEDLGTGDAERVSMDDQTRRALASLGYAWSPPQVRAAGDARDPRVALRTMQQMAEADRLLATGDVDGALEKYGKVIAAEPSSLDAPVRLAQILADLHRETDAVPVLSAALARMPQHPYLYLKLGQTLRGLERLEESLSVFDAGLARHPDARELRDGRWSCLHKLGRRDELLAEAERAVVSDPTDGMARYARALACCKAEGAAAYGAALKRELAELPEDPVLRAAWREFEADPAPR